MISPYVDLPDTFEAYLSDTLSSNTRQKVRRFLRRVEGDDDYKLTTTTPETGGRDVALLVKLWADDWLATKGDATERLSQMYGTIVERGLRDGLVHMTVLWHRGQPIATHASFVDREKSRLLFFVTGRDESFNELPAGLMLHAYNVKWAIEQGLRTYDLLRGDEPYKFSLGAVASQLLYPVVRTTSGVDINRQLTTTSSSRGN